MNASPLDIAALLLAACRNGRALILLFDYDGTLAPYAPRPELARLDEATRRLLQRLNEHPRIWVGIISGRQLDDLEGMVETPGLLLVGTNGIEWDLGGQRFADPYAESARRLQQCLLTLLQRHASRFPGAWVEEKRFGMTLHYRSVEEGRIAEFKKRSSAILDRYDEKFLAIEGAMAIEVVPNLGWTKGTAVRAVLNYVSDEDPLVLYAGDSPNDVEAIQTTAALSGITVGVGPDAPAMAQYRLAGPGELADVLRLCAELPEISRGRAATWSCR